MLTCCALMTVIPVLNVSRNRPLRFFYINNDSQYTYSIKDTKVENRNYILYGMLRLKLNKGG